VLKGRFSWKRSTTGNMSIETGSSDGTYTGKLFAKVRQFIVGVINFMDHHPFMTSTRNSRFSTTLPLSTLVHMRLTPPLVVVNKPANH